MVQVAQGLTPLIGGKPDTENAPNRHFSVRDGFGGGYHSHFRSLEVVIWPNY